MHISIIHDVKNILRNLGHTVDSVCMSGHTWVNGEPQGTTEVINPQNWLYINQDLCNAFYNQYKDRLSGYDAFVHSYPPAFALLFERWNKPIITIACTRFEYPCANRLNWLIEGLNRLFSKGLLIPIANNLLDKMYCEKYTGFTWAHISSLCDYMNVEWSDNKENKIRMWNKSNLSINHASIDETFSINNRYNRDLVITSSRGIVHIPYNVSIMSAFEHYRCNVPMFVPTGSLVKRLKEKHNLLSELYFPGCPLVIDPEWVSLSDWYDDKNMPHTIKFGTLEDLPKLLETTDYTEVSEKMKLYNKTRKDAIYSQWTEILDKIKK